MNDPWKLTNSIESLKTLCAKMILDKATGVDMAVLPIISTCNSMGHPPDDNIEEHMAAAEKDE